MPLDWLAGSYNYNKAKLYLTLRVKYVYTIMPSVSIDNPNKTVLATKQNSGFLRSLRGKTAFNMLHVIPTSTFLGPLPELCMIYQYRIGS